MSAKDQKALVRRMFDEVWNQNHLDVIGELIHDNYLSVEGVDFPFVQGPKIFAEEVASYRSEYSKLAFQIERMFVEGDTVVTTWNASGDSNRESFTDRKGDVVPRRLEAKGISLSKIADGKILSSILYWPRNLLFP
jgi:predicted ester cyclase